MLRIRGRLFLLRWASGDSARASVVAHVCHRDVNDYGLGVDVGHVGNVVHGSVIKEGSVLPISALIADTSVAEAIIYAAVESDLAPQ